MFLTVRKGVSVTVSKGQKDCNFSFKGSGKGKCFKGSGRPCFKGQARVQLFLRCRKGVIVLDHLGGCNSLKG